jgi:hypothetical protein
MIMRTQHILTCDVSFDHTDNIYFQFSGRTTVYFKFERFSEADQMAEMIIKSNEYGKVKPHSITKEVYEGEHCIRTECVKKY